MRIRERLLTAWRVARRTVTDFLAEEGIQWSGAVAFYLVLSIPPLLIAATSIAITVIGEEAASRFISQQVVRFLPAEREVVREIARSTVSGAGPAALVSIAFLLFSGTRVFAALVVAIHVMWRRIEGPGFVRRQTLRLVLLVVVGGLFAVAGALELGLAIAGDALGLPQLVRWLLVAQLLPVALSVAALFTVFKLVPRRAATWRSALVGALLGALLLRAAQAAFTAYLQRVGGFDSAYGPLAGLAAVLTWALVASAIILLAAHFVAVVNRPEEDDLPPGDERRPGDPEAEGRTHGDQANS